MKKTYISLSKPMQFKKFEYLEAPMGWMPLSLLREKINKRMLRIHFTKEEIKQINEAGL